MSSYENSFYRAVPEPYFFAMKRVLITGATGGIGKACSIWLLNQGARIAMVGREMGDLLKIAGLFPSQAICIQCDLSNDSEHYDMVASALENLGGLDILINAAGVFYENDLESASCREHDYLMNINLRAVYSISKLCANSLAKTHGCIINLSSGWGNRPQQGMISYCMSKAGLDMLTKSMAVELAPVRVNAVAPGLVHTKFLGNSIEPTEISHIKRTYREKNPLKKIARVDEIVKAIVFLASKKSNKISGEIIHVDGGMNITSGYTTNWDNILKMNAKFLPNQIRPLSRFNEWLEKNIQKLKGKSKNDAWLKFKVNDSNWATNLADAHYKITDAYHKIDDEDNVLAALTQKKDEQGHIFTVENPKSARYVDEPSPVKYETMRPESQSFTKGMLKGFITKN